MSKSAEILTNEGVDAFRRGDFLSARGSFEAAVNTRPNAQLWMYLAQACAKTGDASAQQKALDRLLVAEPRNLHGLIARADLAHEQGDERAATAFYNMALSTASQLSSLPPGIVTTYLHL